MSGEPRHYHEALQDLLDERLPAGERAALEEHLAVCARCRAALAALERGRAAARGLPPLEPPSGLTARLATALAAEESGGRRMISRRRALVTAGGVLAAAALAVVLLRPGATSSDLVSLVAADFAGYRGGTLGLDLEAGEPALVERLFAARGITFPARVFDLGMMGFRLTGGRAHRLAGRPSAFYAYAGPDGSGVVCQMFQGTVAELPSAPETRTHDGITFRIYRVGATTLVFWQEGGVVCVLAADGDPEALVRLARAKAIKV